MDDLPHYIDLVFLGCVIATFGFLYFAVKLTSKKSNLPTIVLTLLCAWIFIVAVLALNDFYLDFPGMPPNLFMFVGTAMLTVILLFVFKRSRNYIGRIPITALTHIHIIRVPVEIVLWWLFLNGKVPEALTFEGANYDIISGITAPFAAIFLVGLRSKSRYAAILWNVVCLGLLFNIVIRAILATPYFYDPTILEKPNIAVFYFPYMLLPLFVVPAVFFAHIASLYQLIFLPEEEY